jgi:hypothetical protein
MTRFRLYDPNIGRWLSRDPFPNWNSVDSPDRGEPLQRPNHYTYFGNQLPNLLGPEGIAPLVPTQAELLAHGSNLYTYVGNNPVNLIDPLGLDCEARQVFKPKRKTKPKPRKRKRRERKPRSDHKQLCSDLKLFYLGDLANAIGAPFMPLDTIQGFTADVFKESAWGAKASARASGCMWAAGVAASWHPRSPVAQVPAQMRVLGSMNCTCIGPRPGKVLIPVDRPTKLLHRAYDTSGNLGGQQPQQPHGAEGLAHGRHHRHPDRNTTTLMTPGPIAPLG